MRNVYDGLDCVRFDEDDGKKGGIAGSLLITQQ